MKTSLKVQAQGALRADAFDVSESGIGVSSVETIASPRVSLQIRWPKAKSTFSVDAKLVWKRDIEDTGSVYGMEFVGLTEAQKRNLRQQLIKIQVAGLLEEIQEEAVKNQIAEFFLKDMLAYVTDITHLVVRMHAHEEYSHPLQAALDRAQTQILLKGYCLEELLDNQEVVRKVKHYFRTLVGAWVYKSPIVRYGFEKPRGFPGDYKIMEMIYDNKPISKDPSGIYFDYDFLNNPYAVALRQRKDRFREYVHKCITQEGSKSYTVLSIMCGSCREIRESMSAFQAVAPVVFSCLDSDDEALRFAHASLLDAGQAVGEMAEFRFIKENVVDVFNNDALAESLGEQDLVYSVSAADYLSDAAVKKMIPFLYNLLSPRGRLILSHKNSEKTFPAISPDWFCDWHTVSRNKDNILGLIYTCGISKFSLVVESDDFNYIQYFIISKLP